MKGNHWKCRDSCKSDSSVFERTLGESAVLVVVLREHMSRPIQQVSPSSALFQISRRVELDELFKSNHRLEANFISVSRARRLKH